jgi:hypothetical protein
MSESVCAQCLAGEHDCRWALDVMQCACACHVAVQSEVIQRKAATA